MGEPGRFIELASIDNNVINIDEEVLENLFETSETEGALVAIVTVLGSPRSGKSKLLGQMLKYLQNENKITIDEDIANQIPTFGDDPNKNKKCIFTWSKPMFVFKGVKKRVAVYLLDIKGNFTGSNERDYIMLSGLCTCISSSTIYLHGDPISEVSWKHLTSVTAEGLRLIDKEFLIHQKITYVIQNWTKPQEYVFGDKDSEKFCNNLKDKFKNSSREKVFTAYDQFQFFLLPEESSHRYGFLLNKLLTITLDSSHIVIKSFGTETKTSDIVTYIQNHIEAVNYNDDISDNLEDFKCLSGRKQTNEKRNSMSTPKSPVSKGPTYFDIVNQSEGNLPYESNDDQQSYNPDEDENFDLQLAQKGTPEQQEIDFSSTKLKESKAKSECNTSYGYRDENIESDNSDNDNSNDGDVEMEDVSNVMSENYFKGLASVIPQDFATKEEFDYTKYLETLKAEYEQNVSASKTPSPPTSTLSPAEILKQANMKAATVSGRKSPVTKPESSKIVKPPMAVNRPSTNLDVATGCGSDVVKEKLQNLYSVPTNKVVTTSNDPRPDKQDKRPVFQMTSPISGSRIHQSTATSASRVDQSYAISASKEDQRLLQDTIIQVFGNYSLSTNKSSNDILSEVHDFIGTSENKKQIFQEDTNVNNAINAVLKYIEEMEQSFQACIHMNEGIFQKNHERCLAVAMAAFGSSNYLQRKVTDKITEAKDNFHKHNNNVLRDKTKFINFAVRIVKAAYEKEMEAVKNSVIDGPKLSQIHGNLKSKLIGTVKNTCRLDQSPIFEEMRSKLEMELTRLYETINRNNDMKLKTTSKKIDTAALTAKMYYEGEMNGPVRLGVLTEMTQLQNLHETKLSEAKRKFDQLTSTIEVTNLVAETKRGLEIDLLKCYSLLTNEFEEKLKQIPPQTSNSRGTSSLSHNLRSRPNQTTHKVNTDHGGGQYSEEQTVPKPEYGLGIHIETTGVTVSIFRNNTVETIAICSDLVIGYEGSVVVGSNPGEVGKNYIKFSTLFEGNIGHLSRVNWNGENYTFRMEECVSLVLSKWKYLAQNTLNCVIKVCVVAIPSFLHGNESKAIYDAAVIAGFKKIHILRDICSAAVGFTYFSDTRPELRDFILINTTYGKWDAGYYDISKSIKVKNVSGDNFTSVSVWSKKTPENRFKAIISDIIKLSSLKGKKDVILIGNEKCSDEITTKRNQVLYHNENIKNVFFRDKVTISKGCAFIAALLCDDIAAQNRWRLYHPNLVENQKYSWTTIDQPWSSPIKSRSDRHSEGKNLELEEIDRVQKTLRKFVITREDAIEETNSFLISISNKIKNGSVSETAWININRRINDTFKLLRDTNALVPDIDRAVELVQETYDKYTKPKVSTGKYH